MKSPAQSLYDYALRMLDEAEGNILDAYEGTSAEKGIRATYSRKRGHLKRLGRHAGLKV